MRRWLATWIDFLILLFLLLICAGLTTPLPDEVETVVFFFAFLSTAITYYLFLEGLTGFTIGKLIAGIRVVTNDGTTPKFWQGIVRTALRVFEVNPLLFGGVPAGIVAAMSRNKQRIGDMIVDTYVVCKKDLTNIN